MLSTDCQAIPSSRFGISFISRRCDQMHSVEASPQFTAQETELESFQRRVAERFRGLAEANSEELLSIPWILRLLNSFLCCQEEFRVVVFNNKSYLNRAPMDKYISDYFERSVKALDVCNAIRDGIDQIRQWQKQLEIVLSALNNQRCIGEGNLRRAKKASVDLAIGMLDEEFNSTLKIRNRSFDRRNAQREQRSIGHCRSFSWSVSRSWSAAKQLQAIGCNLAAPRANEVVPTNGLNIAVFTMNYVLLFVMWALVAAIPCQDRGLQTHFIMIKQSYWATPILFLHERILEESKRRDRRNTCGLLKEILEIEKCARYMNELTDIIQFPLPEEKESEVRKRVQELNAVYETVKEGLDPLERQVREVFHMIVHCRADGLDSIGGANAHN